jgi:hypothetical protein
MKNQEKEREYSKHYYQEHKEQGREATRKWQQNHKERYLLLMREYYQTHREQVKASQKKCRDRVKTKVLTQYGNGKLACVVCGESNISCLTIDHLAGGGAQHRKRIKQRGSAFYGWLRKEGYPEGYQTLCMNCQFKKREKERECG